MQVVIVAICCRVVAGAAVTYRSDGPVFSVLKVQVWAEGGTCSDSVTTRDLGLSRHVADVRRETEGLVELGFPQDFSVTGTEVMK